MTTLLIVGLVLALPGMVTGVFRWVTYPLSILFEFRRPGDEVVRGHLELMDVDDPSDVRSTQALAMDELDRMGGLVTDLLTLAKSDRPDCIVPSWTNVAMLTDTTLEKPARSATIAGCWARWRRWTPGSTRTG